MSEVFMAELHGKWMARADALTDQARQTNRHLADIADSLRQISRSLEVANATEGDAPKGRPS
jgi:hypothetical protein